jgi:hypothetical protein
MRTISFESIGPSLSVRVTDENLMVALDLLSVITRRDRKKASQTLARIGSKPETAQFLTLKQSPHKKNPRKLISFTNAIQLLLSVPKRTASLEIRKAIAKILADFFECTSPPETAATPATTDDIPALERRATVLRATMDIERQRMQLPLLQIQKCMELTEQCAPLTEDDISKFKLAISTHMLKFT